MTRTESAARRPAGFVGASGNEIDASEHREDGVFKSIFRLTFTLAIGVIALAIVVAIGLNLHSRHESGLAKDRATHWGGYTKQKAIQEASDYLFNYGANGNGIAVTTSAHVFKVKRMRLAGGGREVWSVSVVDPAFKGCVVSLLVASYFHKDYEDPTYPFDKTDACA